MIKVGNLAVYGNAIDNQTRCVHWHSPVDVVAIKFKCCQKYYPCYACHAEEAGHVATVWTKNEFDQKAVLCGACAYELTINEYLQCRNSCPHCATPFNPGCSNHYPLYFQID
ncbi:MAG: chromophore lyase [Cyclobacteriaceae bacterium]|nr:chromophore lyase [Cyclobacteriaceae bacterium]